MVLKIHSCFAVSSVLGCTVSPHQETALALTLLHSKLMQGFSAPVIIPSFCGVIAPMV